MDFYSFGFLPGQRFLENRLHLDLEVFNVTLLVGVAESKMLCKCIGVFSAVHVCLVLFASMEARKAAFSPILSCFSLSFK